MAKKEKFGKFVLLEEIDTTGLGAEYRAAKLSSTGLEKIVSVLRVKQALSAQPEAVKSLMDQVKFAAQLQNPNILKIYGIGKVESSYYISYEFLEGKSLKGIFGRCRQEGFPFSVDHALLIGSKICSALEYAHSRKTEGGARYFHGMLNPSSVLVSYEGEVRVRGFGYWPARVREAGGMTEEESLYLAPEQASGGMGDTRSDVFAVGAMLFETLTGQPLLQGGPGTDIAARLAQARLQNPTGEDDALPKAIQDILRRALSADPAGRYAEVQEMRKGIDTLLFSGDFTPTTFNLAFFMHSLFRDDIERESKTLKEEKDANYLEYLTEDVRPSTKSSPNLAVPAAVAASAAAAHAAPAHAPTAPLADVTPPQPMVAHPPAPHAAPAHAPAAHAPAAHEHEPAPGDAAAGFTFHKEEPAKSKTPLFVGVAVLVLVAAAAAYFLKARGGAPAPAVPAVTTLSPEAAAAMQKVKELESKLQALEAEKAAASQKAEEEAKKKVEAQAAARGQAADPAAVAKAQEEARKKAQALHEQQAAQEQARLEEERKAAEAQLAEEKRKQEEAARMAAAATTTLPAVTAPPTTAAPAVRPGQLVDVSEVGVIAPVALSKPQLTYPQIALRQRVEGRVDLSVLVDEKGNVADAKVVSGAGGKAGLNEAAIEFVRRWKFRAASKDGVPVKTWTPVSINFVLPR